MVLSRIESVLALEILSSDSHRLCFYLQSYQLLSGISDLKSRQDVSMLEKKFYAKSKRTRPRFNDYIKIFSNYFKLLSSPAYRAN